MTALLATQGKPVNLSDMQECIHAMRIRQLQDRAAEVADTLARKEAEVEGLLDRLQLADNEATLLKKQIAETTTSLRNRRTELAVKCRELQQAQASEGEDEGQSSQAERAVSTLVGQLTVQLAMTTRELDKIKKSKHVLESGLRVLVHPELGKPVVELLSTEHKAYGRMLAASGKILAVEELEGWEEVDILHPTATPDGRRTHIYMRPTTDGEEEFALAVIPRLSELETEQVRHACLEFARLLQRQRNHLGRSAAREFEGPCFGHGIRAGYVKGEAYNTYASRRGADPADWAANSHYGQIFLQPLEEGVRTRLPALYWERREFIEANGLPIIEGLSNTINLFSTINYQSCQHTDKDMPEGYAFGLWVEEHEEGCEREAKGLSCWEHWYLAFGEYKIKVRLRDGIVIAWQSAHVVHGTVCIRGNLDKACNSVARSFVTQVKQDLMYRVRKQRRAAAAAHGNKE